MDIDNYKLDLVAFTETWLKANDVMMIEMCPPGYDVTHIPRTIDRVGCVTFVFKKLQGRT